MKNKLEHKLKTSSSKVPIIYDYCEVCGEGFTDKKGIKTKYCKGKPTKE